MLSKKKNQILSYVFITFGLFLYAFGWSAFLIPSEIIGGGVSGVSSIIYLLSGQRIPVGITNLIINGVLLLVALKLLGARFGINTVYGVVVSSAFFILLQQVIKIQNIIHVSEFDPFMCTVIGGALSGAGIGLAFSRGGNSGGTDIIALIVNKYYNITPGKVILILDVFIIASSYTISHSIERVVYGYIQMGVMAYTLDLVLEGAKQSYQILVFSKATDEIAERIGKQVGRGVTLLYAWGWYSKSDQKVLLVVAQKADKQAILEIVKEIDDHAFISLAKTYGVFGENFEKLKL